MPQNHSNRERAREARFILREAIRAARPRSEKSVFPSELMELADVLGCQLRAPIDCPDLERARAIASRGIPRGEMTRRDGSSTVPVMRKGPTPLPPPEAGRGA